MKFLIYFDYKMQLLSLPYVDSQKPYDAALGKRHPQWARSASIIPHGIVFEAVTDT